ncbi:MAG: transcriptional regulator NrdR [Candidatus Nomurabacteria bacterium]|jgi:transcriptional repressor NrdR|nr:transcriptional regulator NrdR [Candidatus Nomurabacteria bacterium]
MRCPKCGAGDSKVVESRDSGESIRRRRECLKCGARFTTYERIERPNLAVLKKDGRRVLFDRDKLARAILRSVGKFLDSETEVDEIVGRVEDSLYDLGELTVSSRQIGDFVMAELLSRNEVAYVRFASVYLGFKTVDEFAKILTELKNGAKNSDSKEQK